MKVFFYLFNFFLNVLAVDNLLFPRIGESRWGVKSLKDLTDVQKGDSITNNKDIDKKLFIIVFDYFSYLILLG
jgi:hypothetical protein